MTSHPILPPLREVIKKHGLTANKALGQNFLLDTQLLDRIAAVPGDLKNQPVFEVGPGPGGLTQALLKAGANVTAVERDERCLPALMELESFFPGQLEILNADALKVDTTDYFDAPYHIVSNLPYNVGSALLIKWLSAPYWLPQWQSLTLMFQREVADRIVADAGSSSYGRLSIMAQWRCHAKLAMSVHRSAFTPPPKVMSAIVHLTPKAQPEDVDPATLATLTQAAFSQRRKMLRQSLKALPGGLDALDAAGIDSSRRPETISISEFVEIARRLSV